MTGTGLIDFYVDVLRTLGRQPGILGDIYAGAQSRFNNPVNLKRLVNLIDEIEWTGLNVDVKAAAYEGLLEKAASEGKKGAGQYFTPRVLIQSIVRCMQPDPRKHRQFTICDPACAGKQVELAAELGVSPPRITQLKGELADRLAEEGHFPAGFRPSERVRPRRTRRRGSRRLREIPLNAGTSPAWRGPTQRRILRRDRVGRVAEDPWLCSFNITKVQGEPKCTTIEKSRTRQRPREKPPATATAPRMSASHSHSCSESSWPPRGSARPEPSAGAMAAISVASAISA